MDKKYLAWIAQNVREYPLGQCGDVTERMAQAFPELRRVRGHYYCPAWGKRGHWWLEDAAGKVVDPTKLQFPSEGAGTYVEFTGNDAELPTGVCMECGEPVFDHSLFCSRSCESAHASYLNSFLHSDPRDY